jgi:hypothetical protein
VVFECNADQLSSVPAELRRDYGMEVSTVDIDRTNGEEWLRPPKSLGSCRTLRTLVAGRDDLGEIPETAPTYLTQLARRQVGDIPLLRRVMAESRVFSTESARQILSFMVRGNLAATTSGPMEALS